MVFAKYSPPRKRFDRAIVAFTRKRIQLNSVCQKKYFENCGFVEIYFDEEDRMVGIKPLREETKDSIIIRKYRNRGIAVIAATHFIEKFNLKELLPFDVTNENGDLVGERSVQIPADWDEKEKMVILRLNYGAVKK